MRQTVVWALMLLLIVASVSSADASDLRMENDRFAIRHAEQDAEIAREIEKASLPIRERIIGDIGVEVAGKTTIDLAPTVEAFRAGQPGQGWIPLWAVGVAYPEKNRIAILSPRAVQGKRIDVDEVFAHEFSHIALGRALAGQEVPVWLDEGLAVYEAREWTLSRVAVLTYAALSDRLIPLRVLTLSFPPEAEDAELAYAEGFMFVAFLINKVGRTAFHRLIRDYIRHGDLEGALRRGTGLPLAELEEQWLFYLKLRVSWIPVITSISTLWFVTALIFIYGYARKRRQARRRLQEMAEEEALEGTWHPNG